LNFWPGQRILVIVNKTPKTPAVGPYGAHIEIVMDEKRNEARISRISAGYRFAWELRHAAQLMVIKAREVTDQDSLNVRPFVTAAVILAYSFLEAGLNEFMFFNAPASPLSDAEKAMIKTVRSDEERLRGKSTLEIFNLMLTILKKEELASGREPYQAAEAVRELRNLLVHPRPGYATTFSDDPKEDLTRQHHITKQLRAHLNLDRSATFPGSVLTSECARWAVRSCESFFGEFVKRSGVKPGFITDGRC
jgi:hypothetical protein